MATATKKTAANPKTATFHSRHGAFRIVRVPEFVGINSWGQQVKHQPFEGLPVTRAVYEFEKGTLEVIEGDKNWHVLPDGPGGEMQDTIEYLRRHEEFNKRFHESGNEPDRPLPTESDFNRLLRKNLLNLDLDATVAMLQTERETHNRPELVKAADETRREILLLRQQHQDAPPPEAA